jgi:hypothetical protein
MRRKRKSVTSPKGSSVAIGVAWYRREQWPRLLEISADRDKLEESYEDWFSNVSKTLGLLKSKGLDPVKVPVDTEELLAWCRSRNLPVDAKARTEYTVGKVKEIHRTPPPC